MEGQAVPFQKVDLVAAKEMMVQAEQDFGQEGGQHGHDFCWESGLGQSGLGREENYHVHGHVFCWESVLGQSGLGRGVDRDRRAAAQPPARG